MRPRKYVFIIVCGKIIFWIGLLFFPLWCLARTSWVRCWVPTTPLATTVGRGGGGGPMWMTRGAVVRLRSISAAAAVVALRALVASSAINEPCRRRSTSRLPLFVVWLHRAPCSSPHGKLVWPPKLCCVDRVHKTWCDVCLCTSDQWSRIRGVKNNKNRKYNNKCNCLLGKSRVSRRSSWRTQPFMF